MICRDVNYHHQAETRLTCPDDIIPFLEDELYGLECSRAQLEKILNGIYTSGRGFWDAASLVHGESWLDDALKYGFVDAPLAPEKPYAANAPAPDPRGRDLLTNFLDEAARADSKVQHARALLGSADSYPCSPD